MNKIFLFAKHAKSGEDCKKYSTSVSYETLVGGTTTVGGDYKQTRCLSKDRAGYRFCKTMRSSYENLVDRLLQTLPVFKKVCESRRKSLISGFNLIRRSLEFFAFAKNRDDSLLFSASPRTHFCEIATSALRLLAMTMPTLVLAAVLSFSVVSESWADYKYTYDDYGNAVVSYSCSSATNCTPSTVFNNTYDENGRMISYGYCNVSNVDSSGNCIAYSERRDYTYDGNRMYISYCNSFDSSGNCTGYRLGEETTYDANGKQVSFKQCTSSQIDTSGNCTAYYSRRDYTYNGNVRQTKSCNSSLFDINGYCTSYSSVSDETYDANGNIIYSRSCDSSHIDSSSGNCTAYTSGVDYTYDANGKNTTYKTCDISQGFNADGSCSVYKSTLYYHHEYTDEYLACMNRVNGKCETCGEGYYKKAGTCVSSTTGCGDGYTANNETMQCVKNSSEESSANEPINDGPSDSQGSGQPTAANCAEKGEVLQGGVCVSSCGASFRLNEGECDRIRYTPAEAAQYLKDTDNEIIMTFKVNR